MAKWKRYPNGQGRIAFAARFSQEEIDALYAMAKELNTSLSEALRICVREKINN